MGLEADDVADWSEYQPSLLSHLWGAFASVDGAQHIAELPESGLAWYSYALGSSGMAVFIALVGTCCAVFTALNLSRPAPAPKTANSLPYLVGAGLFLALIWLSAMFSLRSGLDSYGFGFAGLQKAADAMQQLQEDLNSMNNTAAVLQGEVGGLLGACGGLGELVRRSLGGDAVDTIQRLEANAAGELLGFRSLLARLRPGAGAVEHVLGMGAMRISSWPGSLRYFFMAPVKTLAVAAAALAALHFARGAGENFEESIDAVGLGRLAAMFSLCVVFVAGISGACVFGLGASAGAFCVDADGAILGLAGSAAHELGAEVLIGNVAQSYILGKGRSPLLMDLAEARSRSDTVQTLLAESAPIVSSLRLYCPEIQDLHINRTALALRSTAERDLALLQMDAMHKYYAQAVHEGFCGSHLDALGRLAFFQCVIGLVGLPLAAALARPFIGQGAGKEAPPPGSPHVLRPPYGRVGYEPEGPSPRPRGRADAGGPPSSRQAALESGRLLGAEGAASSVSASRSTSFSGWGAPVAVKTGAMGMEDVGGRRSVSFASRADLNAARDMGNVEFLREASRQGSDVTPWDFARGYATALVSFASAAAGGEDAGRFPTLDFGQSSPSPSQVRAAEQQLISAADASPSLGGATDAPPDPLLNSFMPKRSAEAASPHKKSKYDEAFGRRL